MKVAFSGMIFLMKFVKSYFLVQKLLWRTHEQMNGQMDRQIGDLISHMSLFKESRLKIYLKLSTKTIFPYFFVLSH
jgi:hypothetical protein